MGGVVVFVDGLDDEVLFVVVIVSGEDVWDVGGVVFVFGFEIGVGVGFEVEVFDEGLFGFEEVYCEEYELGGVGLFGVGLFDGDELIFFVFILFDLYCDDGGEMVVGVGVEFFNCG